MRNWINKTQQEQRAEAMKTLKLAKKWISYKYY